MARLTMRPPRISVWLPVDQAVTYFVTICVRPRADVLASGEVFAAVKSFTDSNVNWNTLALVVMPDHLHALVQPLDRAAPITQFTAGLKRHVRRATTAQWRWQDGAFDRLLRTEESAQSKWEYMRANPVRAELVSHWEEWPYQIGL